MATIFQTYYKLIKAKQGTEYFYVKNTDTNTKKVKWKINHNPGSLSEADIYSNIKIHYRTENETKWHAYKNDEEVQLPSNTKVYFRSPTSLVYSYKQTPTSSPRYATVSLYAVNGGKTLELGGNIASLVNYYEMGSGNVTIPDYCFYNFSANNNLYNTISDFSNLDFSDIKSIGGYACFGMFKNCTTTNPFDLSNVTSIGIYACQDMFNNCKSLTTASDLSSVTSLGDCACYEMYQGCTSLTTPSDLSNVTSLGWHACRNMYSGCTSLTTGSDLSNVTTIEVYACQGMYSGCTSLTTPSDLSSVITLPDYACYQMYQGCTSLTTPSDLSNVTSLGEKACYGMYTNCSALTTGSNLSNVTTIGTQALYYAFQNCYNLQTVYAPNVSEWNTSKFTMWVFSAGTQAATPKQMIFQTQELLDICPSGGDGYGIYTKVLA